MKAKATSTANSGIANRAQELDGFGAGTGFGGGALDDAAAAADEDAADAAELADADGLVCSCWLKAIPYITSRYRAWLSGDGDDHASGRALRPPRKIIGQTCRRRFQRIRAQVLSD
jgi:hypothetical protein